MDGPAREGIVDPGRDETHEEQADRNWNELLQELRVMQTGTQILVAFLFTIPFQPTFEDLDDVQRGAYLSAAAQVRDCGWSGFYQPKPCRS